MKLAFKTRFYGYNKMLREILLKGRVHCFSMQVIMNKCFLLSPEKKLEQIRLVVFEKNTKTRF